MCLQASAKLANSSQPQPARHSPASSSSFHSIPSAPMYPPIDPTAGNSMEAPTRTNPQLAAQTTQVSLPIIDRLEEGPSLKVSRTAAVEAMHHVVIARFPVS